MNTYNSRRGLADRLSVNFAGMSKCRRSRARGDFNLFEEAILPVETEHPEFPDLKPRHNRREVGQMHGCDASDWARGTRMSA